MAKVSTKKTTTKKTAKAAAPVEAPPAAAPVAAAPAAKAVIEAPAAPVPAPIPAPAPVSKVKPKPTPPEPMFEPERTVDSIKAAAQADAQRDASNFEAAKRSAELRPPSGPVEASEDDARFGDRRVGYQRDKIAASLNIAKLQCMSMTELNGMAKEYGVENFGTMRKHEVIFHILEKNAARSGVLFSEGVIEVLPEGFGFLRSQSFNYLPCPEDIYVSPSQIRRFDLQTGNLVAGQIRPPK